MSWADDALAGDLTDKVEVICVIGDNLGVDTGSWHWVGKSVGVITVEETLADSLVDEDEDNLDWQVVVRHIFSRLSDLPDGKLHLWKLIEQDSLALRITDTISVDNQILWEPSILALEFIQSFGGQQLNRVSDFLTFILNFGTRPVLCGTLVHTGTESHDGLGAISDFMVNINTTDHGRLVEEGHVADGPWLTTDLGTDLYQDLGANTPHILAS